MPETKPSLSFSPQRSETRSSLPTKRSDGVLVHEVVYPHAIAETIPVESSASGQKDRILDTALEFMREVCTSPSAPTNSKKCDRMAIG